jgi:hypothetical protein
MLRENIHALVEVGKEMQTWDVGGENTIDHDTQIKNKNNG